MYLNLFNSKVRARPFSSPYWDLADKRSPDKFKAWLPLTLTIVGQYYAKLGDFWLEDLIQEAVIELRLLVDAGDPKEKIRVRIHGVLKKFCQPLIGGLRTNQRLSQHGLPNERGFDPADLSDDVWSPVVERMHDIDWFNWLAMREQNAETADLFSLAQGLDGRLSPELKALLSLILAGEPPVEIANTLQISQATFYRRHEALITALRRLTR